MTLSPLRRLGLALFTALAFGLLAGGGCSRQGEGERCDFLNAGDEDCDDGLVCVQAINLVSSGADRCCPPPDERITDSRCTRSTGTSSGDAGARDSGSSGSSGTGGAGGDDGMTGSSGSPASGGGGTGSEPGGGAGGA